MITLYNPLYLRDRAEDECLFLCALLCIFFFSFDIVITSFSQGPPGLPGLKGDPGKKGDKVCVRCAHMNVS